MRTITDYKYDGVTLLGFSATQGSASWRIDYLYDENDVLYGGVYRDPSTSTTPTVFGAVTTDRGDVVELLDTNGAAFAAYRYDAWGNPTSTVTQATGLINSTLAANIASRQLLRYASYCYDSESGLYYCSARSYDPATRQWISKDPEEADAEESAFQYSSGDPVGCTDSTGEDAVSYGGVTQPELKKRYSNQRGEMLKCAIRNMALKWVNKVVPYVWGGPFHNEGGKWVWHPPSEGLDCSGFVQLVLNRAGKPYDLGMKAPKTIKVGAAGLYTIAGWKGKPIEWKYVKRLSGQYTAYQTGDVLVSSDHVILVIDDGRNPRVAECTPHWGRADGTQVHRLRFRWTSWKPPLWGRYFKVLPRHFS